jgi:hypothetical protein
MPTLRQVTDAVRAGDYSGTMPLTNVLSIAMDETGDPPGARHEAAGRDLFPAHEVDAELARFAGTHASWAESGIGVEDLLVSLAAGRPTRPPTRSGER